MEFTAVQSSHSATLFIEFDVIQHGLESFSRKHRGNTINLIVQLCYKMGEQGNHKKSCIPIAFPLS